MESRICAGLDKVLGRCGGCGCVAAWKDCRWVVEGGRDMEELVRADTDIDRLLAAVLGAQSAGCLL